MTDWDSFIENIKISKVDVDSKVVMYKSNVCIVTMVCVVVHTQGIITYQIKIDDRLYSEETSYIEALKVYNDIGGKE
ncbi:hypothetical protein FDI40_gp456 [Agrobacterium phage Atu_ph07]|uniref:Uncharacterized protein n=1 Tax=Agrobacterium phage Atu_ph07 TaxID=2024264 RepID=A0A2L0V0B3_9CAUD|nr:hypothetical protein FDI40_gp456 [Agrobacterium phage Atu_ph07]AUZ95215.1 hypothetical protein [Agrobacterium phage Atu_ph07]